MDYREVLEQLRGYVQKPVSEEAGKICKTVRALNREQMAVLLTDSEKDVDSLEVQLQNSEYVIALKKELVKSDIDEILYQLGKFEGMTRITAAAKTRQAESLSSQTAIHFMWEEGRMPSITWIQQWKTDFPLYQQAAR